MCPKFTGWLVRSALYELFETSLKAGSKTLQWSRKGIQQERRLQRDKLWKSGFSETFAQLPRNIPSDPWLKNKIYYEKNQIESK